MEHKGGHWYAHEESIVRTVGCQKAPLAKAMSNSEKIKSVALIVELRWSEGIGKAVNP